MTEDPHPGTVAFAEAMSAGAGLQVRGTWSNQYSFHMLIIQSEIEEIKKSIKMDDGANIQFTSGTTGSPKV